MSYKKFYVVFSMMLAGCGHHIKPTDWYSVSVEKTLGISGIAAVDSENLLVIHDNKKINEPRLSQIIWSQGTAPILKKLNWCNEQKLPIDLEAIAAIPSHDSEFLVLESKGQVSRIRFHHSHCDVVSQFMLPNVTTQSNIESLALLRLSSHTILVWAERGDDQQPAKMRWGDYDSQNNNVTLSNLNAIDFFAPYPNENRRSISDIAINKDGTLWVSAVSDPGDNGAFQSALYKLGMFIDGSAGIYWKPYLETPIQAQYDDVKIEGLTFIENTLIMGSDDENLGAKIANFK